MTVLSGVSEGSPIVFDNSDFRYVVTANGTVTNPVIPGRFLDPTLSPEQQGSGIPNRSVFFSSAVGGGSSSVRADQLTAGPAIAFTREITGTIVVDGPLEGQQTVFRPADTLLAGELVGPNLNFEGGAPLGYFAPALDRHRFFDERIFVGFRISLNGAFHFGYLELDYRLSPLLDGGEIMAYQPRSWAYESIPNTPIMVVPGPGVALAGGAGLLAAAGRRGEGA